MCIWICAEKYMCVSECSDRAGKESKEYVFGCYSSPLGGGIRTGLTARNEFTRLDLPETISLCGLHTFRVATCPPPPGPQLTTHSYWRWPMKYRTLFYRTHAFYLFLFSPCSFLFSLALSRSLSYSFLFLSLVHPPSHLSYSLLIARSYEWKRDHLL